MCLSVCTDIHTHKYMNINVAYSLLYTYWPYLCVINIYTYMYFFLVIKFFFLVTFWWQFKLSISFIFLSCKQQKLICLINNLFPKKKNVLQGYCAAPRISRRKNTSGYWHRTGSEGISTVATAHLECWLYHHP